MWDNFCFYITLWIVVKGRYLTWLLHIHKFYRAGPIRNCNKNFQFCEIESNFVKSNPILWNWIQFCEIESNFVKLNPICKIESNFMKLNPLHKYWSIGFCRNLKYSLWRNKWKVSSCVWTLNQMSNVSIDKFWKIYLKNLFEKFIWKIFNATALEFLQNIDCKNVKKLFTERLLLTKNEQLRFEYWIGLEIWTFSKRKVEMQILSCNL